MKVKLSAKQAVSLLKNPCFLFPSQSTEHIQTSDSAKYPGNWKLLLPWSLVWIIAGGSLVSSQTLPSCLYSQNISLWILGRLHPDPLLTVLTWRPFSPRGGIASFALSVRLSLLSLTSFLPFCNVCLFFLKLAKHNPWCFLFSLLDGLLQNRVISLVST